MKSTRQYSIVLVTAPNLKVARQLAKTALEARLVACANLIPKMESHYWWQGKIESSPEVLILMKTPTKALVKLEKVVLANHPYDTPEFISFRLTSGNERYLEWLRANTC